MPEGVASLDHVVHGHGGPLPVHGGHQGIDVGMANSSCLALNVLPESKVQWVCIRALWGPELRVRQKNLHT